MAFPTAFTKRQSDTLRLLVKSPNGIAREQLDGRVLRALTTRQLVEDRAGVVHVTNEGRRASQQAVPAERSPQQSLGPETRMSVAQQELLRTLNRRSGPVGVDEIDGRSAKGLVVRGFARYLDDACVEITDSGREAFQALGNPSAHRRRRGRSPREHPRAETILRAVEQLEKAVPTDSELLVGPILAHVDDVLFGFRRFARELKQRPQSS